MVTFVPACVGGSFKIFCVAFVFAVLRSGMNNGKHTIAQKSKPPAAIKTLVFRDIQISALMFYSFPCEQLALPFQTAAESADFSVRRQHPMARHQHRNGIRPARPTHGPDGFGFANRLRHFAVAFRPAKRDFPHFTPDGFLKCRSRCVEWRKIFRFGSSQDVPQCGFCGTMPFADFVGNL